MLWRSGRFTSKICTDATAKIDILRVYEKIGVVSLRAGMNNFFAELKRRNVYKVAVAYMVVAWLLIQAASILFPTFEAPAWVMKVFVAVLVLGFPIALIFSWAFEITPEGIKRESEVAPNESISRHTGRKIVALTIVLAVVAAGLLAFQLLRGTSKQKYDNQSTDARGISEQSI